ncbi:hypothetical protein [Sphingopyxis sp. FD7]|uniref:hypothetical protein n=1 Tax=Sphingopyxis sp. FD7 TaxID=1914525 RepID=UPI000DC62E53|nr:hypothetical protein [Sphingopyxis sp. FD7]BBB13644.1 acetamidase [Sphingopyxis sp. FD7]
MREQPFEIWARETYGDRDFVRRNYAEIRRIYDSDMEVKPTRPKPPPPRDRYDEI